MKNNRFFNFIKPLSENPTFAAVIGGIGAIIGALISGILVQQVTLHDAVTYNNITPE